MQPRGDISCRILGTLEEIEAIAEAWRGLEAHCADPLGYFQSYEWCRGWVEQFGGKAAQTHVMTLWRGDVLIALWPRMVVQAAGIRRLETLGAPHSQYCGVLVRRGTVPMAEVTRHFNLATKAAGCDVAICRAVPAGTVLAEMISGKPKLAGADNVASMLDLSGFASPEDYVSGLGKLRKRNRNRRRNHLARLGALSFEVIWPDHPDFADLVRRCTDMKRRWLAETGRFSSGFSMKGYEDLLAGLPGDAQGLSGACLSVLRAGERVVALELGFIRQRHYYAYIGGFDWELCDLSPGKVQMDFTVGWLIEHGAEAYDLLINPAEYKTSWTNKSVKVTVQAQALSWKGRVYASAWLPSVRPALKRLNGKLPALMERIASILRPAACLLLYV